MFGHSRKHSFPDGLAARPEKPLRDELLSIEGLEERAKALAARFTIDPTPRRRSRSVFRRFDDNARVLRDTYRSLAEEVHGGEFVTPAAEWLLDNFHLVASEIRDIHHNLPRGYYRELPKLASRELSGHARVYAMAVELIRHSDSRLERRELLRFVNSYQTVAPLTIGELWAWPSMLKLALIENLRRLADEMMEAHDARRAADAYVTRIEAAGDAGEAWQERPPPLPAVLHPAFVLQLLQRMREYGPSLSAVRAAVGRHLATEQMTPEDAIRSEHQRQAASQVSVANVITSLRICATLDWSEYFEAVSLVQRILDRDPAGAYRSMDFLSRDRYRQATEQLSERTGEAQLRVALRAIESARLSVERGAIDGSTHVGYHLIGKGRRDLETDLAYRPSLGGRLRRFVFAHATSAYLGWVSVATTMLCGLGLAYVREMGGSPWAQAVAVLALLIPASEVAIAFTQRMAAHVAKPRRLVRFDYLDGIPEGARTLVVVPTLLTSVVDARERIEHLEVLALGNLDPRIHFAILSDFTDGPEPELPEDEATLNAAREGIQALNDRLGPGRFYLLHRRRQWNPREGVWMG
ncbi:MAG: GH36-type glycosyl hydrolase domain-containing protein, partial [Vicinamibacteria bacterium]